jgi:hypothetical protein
MEVVYFIKIDGSWQQVSHEEYMSFAGEKQCRPSTWVTSIINEMLLPYRFI